MTEKQRRVIKGLITHKVEVEGDEDHSIWDFADGHPEDLFRDYNGFRVKSAKIFKVEKEKDDVGKTGK